MADDLDTSAVDDGWMTLPSGSSRIEDVVVGHCYDARLHDEPYVHAHGEVGYRLVRMGGVTLCGHPSMIDEDLDLYSPGDFGRQRGKVLGMTWFFVDSFDRPCRGFYGEKAVAFESSLERFCHVYGDHFRGLRTPHGIDVAA